MVHEHQYVQTGHNGFDGVISTDERNRIGDGPKPSKNQNVDEFATGESYQTSMLFEGALQAA
jgi:hypothetical protein